MTNRLMVVDGDPRDLRVVEACLNGAGYEVAGYSNAAAAWEAIQTDPAVDLLIVADSSPGLDAFALCERLKQRSGPEALQVMLLLPDLTREGRVRAIQAGADDVLAKPISTAEIVDRTNALCRRRARDRLLKSATPLPEDLTGNIGDIRPVDLLTAMEDGHRSGVLHLQTATGVAAAIYVRGGKPVDAEVGRLSGLPALTRIFGWVTGTYRIELKSIRRPDALPGSTAGLVLAGLGHQGAAALGGLRGDEILEVDAAMLIHHAASVSAEHNGLLRGIDGARTVRAVIDASAMPDDETMKALDGLVALGILRPSAKEDSEDSADSTELQDDDEAAGAMPDDVPVPQPADGAVAEHASAQEPDELGVLPEPGPVLAVAAETSMGTAAEDFLSMLPDSDADPAFETPIGSPVATLEDAIGGVATVADVTALSPAAATVPMNRTLPLGLAGPEVPEHLRALIRESSELPPPGVTSPASAPPLSGTSDDGDAPAALAPALVAPDGAPSAGGDTGERATSALGEVPAAPPALHPLSPDPGPLPAPGQPVPFYPAGSSDGFTAEQALEELRFSGRGRLRRIAAVVALAGLAAFGARTWLAKRRAPAVSALAAPRPSAQPPSPPRAIAVPTAPAVAAGAVVVPARPPAVLAAPPEAAPPEAEVAEVAEVAGAPAAGPAPKTGRGDGPPTGVSPRPVKEGRHPPIAAESRPSPPQELPDRAAESGAARSLETCRTALERHGRRRSLKVCEQALLSNPRSAEALTLLAQVEMNRGHMKRAQELATQAVDVDPDMAEAYAVLGGILQDSGRDHEAKVAYRKYLQLAPHGRYADDLRSVVRTM